MPCTRNHVAKMDPFESSLLPSIFLFIFLLDLPSTFPLENSQIILESPQITDRGDWGPLVTCSSNPYAKLAIGLQLRVDYRDPFNEDNTALNGIWLACENPHMNKSEDDLLSHKTEWISSAGTSYGQFQRRLFCGSDENGRSYMVGFRLKSQQDQGPLVDDVGAVNMKMICSDGEEIEGFDEKENLYPDVEYTEAVKCPEGMGVCGMQTQVEEIQWEGDNTALNNVRIKCCTVPESELVLATTTESLADEAAITIIAGKEEGPEQQLVRLFEHQIGIGSNESIAITSGQCNPIPDNWIGRVGSLEYKADCIRIWEKFDCSGYTRCHCDEGFMPLDNSMPMSRNVSSWTGRVNGLTMCIVENENFTSFRMFSEKNFQGEHEYRILFPEECLTFFEGDEWRGRLGSIVLVDGCVEYFDGEECTGNSKHVVTAQESDASVEMNNLKPVLSLRNCATHLMKRP